MPSLPPPAVLPTVFARNKYLFLLLVLGCLLLLHPILEGNRFQVAVFSVLVSLMLLSNVYILGVTHFSRLVGILLAIPEISSIWWHLLTASPTAEILKFVFFIPFHLFTIICIYRDLFSKERITPDEVRGTICLYVLIAATWSALYYLIELLQPGAFYVTHAGRADHAITWYDFLYYSFTTLGSVGFGDITPVYPLARALTMFQSVAGIFYVAVVVAKMVSQFIKHSEAQTE